MNRLILIPALLSVAGLVAWCIFVPAEIEPLGKNGSKSNNDYSAGTSSLTKASFTRDARSLSSVEEIQQILFTTWKDAETKIVDEASNDRYAFSRFKRPARAPRPKLVVASRFAPKQDIEGLQLGQFEIEKENQEVLQFPIAISNSSGDTSIYADGKWRPFHQWVLERQGVSR